MTMKPGDFIVSPIDDTEDLRKQGMYAMTGNLSEVIKDAYSSGNDEKGTKIADMLDFYIESYEKLTTQIKDSPESRSWNWNKVIDRDVAENKKDLATIGRTISCKKGCAWCCGQNITITIDEAMLLVGSTHLKDGAATIDWDKAEEQAKLDFSPDKFCALPWEIKSCPLLDMDTHMCTAYENRPGVCRTYYSVDDVEKCKTDLLQEISKFVPIFGEIAVSSSWNVARNGPMPIMLLEAKKLWKQRKEKHEGN